MAFNQNEIILEKALSYGRLVTSFIIHLVLSLVIGPLIAVFLYGFYIIALGLDPSLSKTISQEKLVGYWFLLIVILVFGLIWLGFINNRKNDLLASQKCQRWYYEYWNILFDNVQDPQKIPHLPVEASSHYQVRTIAMDKALPRTLGIGIVVAMSPIMAVFSYFTPSIISQIDQNANVAGVAKFLGTLFWLVLFIISVALLIYFVQKKFFKPNVEHSIWRQFWINLILVTLMNDQLYVSMKGYEASQVSKITSAFSDKYKDIYQQLSTALANQNNTLTVDQLDWLENMINDLENTPNFLIPPSISLISKFYTYAIIAVGVLSSVLLGPASYVLNSIMHLFFGI